MNISVKDCFGKEAGWNHDNIGSFYEGGTHSIIIFVDSTLYYYGTKNEDEAYYLCGMLNIPDLAKSVKIISDTRHHHKRPLYFNIPKFKDTQEQLKITALSKMCSQKVKNYVLGSKKIKETEIRNLVIEELIEIRNIGINILRSASPIRVIPEYKFQ